MLAKLIKYELFRKKNVLLAFLATTVVTEIFLLVALSIGGKWLPWFLFISILLSAGTLLFLIVEGVRLLSDDLSKKSGYMLFLTPNHGYNIIGAKLLISFFEVLVTIGLLYIIHHINYTYGMALYYDSNAPVLKELVDGLNMVIQALGFSWLDWAILIFSKMISWFLLIVTAYLAIILIKTVFSIVRYKKALSFTLFLGLTIMQGFIGQLAGLIYVAMFGHKEWLHVENLSIIMNNSDFTIFVKGIVGVATIVTIVLVVGFYWLSSYLLTKKMDL